MTIVQVLTMRSPRDAAWIHEHDPHVIRRPFTIFKTGRRPAADLDCPPKAFPALWRGKEAGGTDEGEWLVEGKGRLPNDEVLRPSTLEG